MRNQAKRLAIVLVLAAFAACGALLFAPQTAWAQATIKDDRLTFGPEFIEFQAFAKTIAEFCKVNVILPDNLKEPEKVSVLTKQAMSKGEAWQVFIWLLENMGATFFQSGPFKKFVPELGLMQAPSVLHVKTLPPEAEKEPHVNLLYELSNADAETVKKAIEPLVSRGGRMVPFKNKLLIIERQRYIPRLLDFIKRLDVGGAGTRIYSFQARYSPISDIQQLVESLFMKGSGGADKKLSGLQSLVPDDRTNTLYVIGGEAACRQVMAFLPKLDLPIERSTRMEVVFLKHAKAEELQTTLQAIVKPQSSKSSARRQFGEDLEVKVQADKATNSLVLVGPGRGIVSLKRTIQLLDRFPRQVFLEAVIMEISITDEKDLGVALAAARKINAIDSTVVGGTALSGLNAASVSASALAGIAMGVRGSDVAGSGTAYGLGFNFPSFGSVIRALQLSSKVNVLSNPYLIASDKEEAQILVGSNVPFITGTSRDNFNQPVLSIQRQDVALTVKLKPEIGEGKNVTMKIEVKIEDIASVSETMGPTTTKRSIKATARAVSGSRVALGGLMRKRELHDKSSVPGIGQVPLIGRLFSASSDTHEHTNLMIIVTPTVLETPEDIKAVFKRKLAERDEYVRQMYGKENSDYDIPKDFDDRVGIAETIRQAIEEEKRIAREGQHDESIVITPETAAQTNGKENEKDTDDTATETLVPLDFNSAPPPESAPVPMPPEAAPLPMPPENPSQPPMP